MTTKQQKTLGEMTDTEFERYLKKHKLSGMGAVRAAAKRREQIAAKQKEQA